MPTGEESWKLGKASFSSFIRDVDPEDKKKAGNENKMDGSANGVNRQNILM